MNGRALLWFCVLVIASGLTGAVSVAFILHGGIA